MYEKGTATGAQFVIYIFLISRLPSKRDSIRNFIRNSQQLTMYKQLTPTHIAHVQENIETEYFNVSR